MSPPSPPRSPEDQAAESSDETLMFALAAGDRSALDPLMLRWQRPLQNFLHRHLQNEADALDLAQETFVRVFVHRARYRHGARFSTWMFQIAINLARDHGRKQVRRRTDSLDALTESSASAGDSRRACVQFSDSSPGPADAARKTEEIAAVRAALRDLPEDLRAVLVFSEYERLSHAEIAAIVGGTPKAVEGRLGRARAKLRAALTSWLNG